MESRDFVWFGRSKRFWYGRTGFVFKEFTDGLFSFQFIDQTELDGALQVGEQIQTNYVTDIRHGCQAVVGRPALDDLSQAQVLFERNLDDDSVRFGNVEPLSRKFMGKLDGIQKWQVDFRVFVSWYGERVEKSGWQTIDTLRRYRMVCERTPAAAADDHCWAYDLPDETVPDEARIDLSGIGLSVGPGLVCRGENIYVHVADGFNVWFSDMRGTYAAMAW